MDEDYKDCGECVQIIEYENPDKHPNGCGKCGRSFKELKIIEEGIYIWTPPAKRNP